MRVGSPRPHHKLFGAIAPQQSDNSVIDKDTSMRVFLQIKVVKTTPQSSNPSRSENLAPFSAVDTNTERLTPNCDKAVWRLIANDNILDSHPAFLWKRGG
jgi:hypothetical protein